MASQISILPQCPRLPFQFLCEARLEESAELEFPNLIVQLVRDVHVPAAIGPDASRAVELGGGRGAIGGARAAGHACYGRDDLRAVPVTT